MALDELFKNRRNVSQNSMRCQNEIWTCMKGLLDAGNIIIYNRSSIFFDGQLQTGVFLHIFLGTKHLTSKNKIIENPE
jgi:hypothetical protein